MIIKPAKGKIIKIYSIFFLIALVVFYFFYPASLFGPQSSSLYYSWCLGFSQCRFSFLCFKFNYYEVDKTPSCT